MPPKVNVTKAVILAGGKGTRLYPVAEYGPKSLLFVGAKPILNYLVDLFLEHGVDDIALLISRGFREDFEEWERRYYMAQKIAIFEEKEPLGTFGGLYLLKNWVGKDHFFVMNGDELKDVDLRGMQKVHLRSPDTTIGTLALVESPAPQDYGVVLTDSRDDRVTEFLEKPQNPPSKYINSGLYLLSSEIFDYHPGPKFSMFENDIFPKLAKERKLAAFKFQGRWMDCGTWERYEQAMKEWGSETRDNKGDKA